MRFISKLALFSSVVTSLWAGSYPMAVFDRPFTMPQNSFETILRFDNSSVMQLGFDYGVTHNFQLGIGWEGMEAPAAATPVPKRSFNLTAAHFLFATPYASSMATLTLPIFFEKMALQKVDLGMPLYVPIKRGHVNVVFFDNLMTLNWQETTQATFHFPVRLSWQATRVLCLNLVTKAGSLNTESAHTHIVKQTPLHFKALYAISPEWDIVGSTGFDNIQNASNFSIMLGVNFRGGALDT